MPSFTNPREENVPSSRSNLRQVVVAGSPPIDESESFEVHEKGNASVIEQDDNGLKSRHFQYVCNISIHDVASSKEDVVVNVRMFASNAVAVGDVMQITGIQGSSHIQYTRHGPYNLLGNNCGDLPNVDKALRFNNPLFFCVKPMPSEMLSKYPDSHLSVSSQIAAAFHLAKGSQAVLKSTDKASCAASHVELIFRDQYLARADMWRLVNAELADECLYKGQRIVFQGNIKASVNSIFINGRKASSAHFTSSTKPIFRSESARFVLFVQMSKEMWEFDAEGTGEIMFDKVINGFLPELFKRWEEMQAKHLLSIILFSRMIYENQSPEKEDSEPGSETHSAGEETNSARTKDFYRVVVSDMPSGETADILDQLKREFKVFLRDTSLRKPEVKRDASLQAGLLHASSDTRTEIIAGRPSIAAHGNILEAINLASSQFSSDYIDRDLVRTGVSIVVISPGTGLFEVDYDLLAATTDNLTDNGVGIDLVCLSRMPLHSVPLFQYRNPQSESKSRSKIKDRNTPSSYQSCGTLSPFSFSPGSNQISSALFHGWRYGIPHWIDVSFWAATEENPQYVQKRLPKSKLKPEELHGPKHKPFTPRVKMYELQMMGVMKYADREIWLPQLLLEDRHASSRLGQPSTSIHSPVSQSFQLTGTSSFDKKQDQLGYMNSKHTSLPHTSASKSPLLQPAHIRKMDEYDDALFRHPLSSRRRRPQRRSKQRLRKEKQPSDQSVHARASKSSLSIAKGDKEVRRPAGRFQAEGTSYPLNNEEFNGSTESREAGDIQRRSNAITRSISFGLRGLTPKATPTLTAQVDVTQSSAWTTKTNPIGMLPSNTSTLSTKQNSVKTSASALQTLSDQDSSNLLSSDSDHQDSRAISIWKTASAHTNDLSAIESSIPIRNRSHQLHDRVLALSDLKGVDNPLVNVEDLDEGQSFPPVLSPRTTLAPWLTILNPSNPSKTKLAETSRLGRWQHAFPRAPKSSQMKWKSLCSPAAIPLTTEEFPTSEELEEEYKRDSYFVTLPEEMDMSEHPRSLAHELLAFRLSRGFQIVVGSRLLEVQPAAAFNAEYIFGEKIFHNVDSTVFLSRGSTIHQMTRSGPKQLKIEVFTRHSVAANEKKAEDMPLLYSPAIRSMLADTYEPQSISIAPQRASFNWDIIDSFIAGHERPEPAQYVENLRPWRARYVLIPVDPPSNARRTIRPSEDNEEEIRLEGIRKLTQLWQRFRFVPSDESAYHQPHLRKSKDPNPLDISYQTKDPSAVIAAELESVLEGDETGRPVQLLPEPDLYQRSNLNLKTLAETLQGDRGVRMLDRRWHWRLHYSCFIGFELTTWLLQNFRDIDTRDEAEELGKELMKNGLFKHVEQRHGFRDGNYFYQMEAEYRTPRTESKGWFGRSKSSVPSTPAIDKSVTELPRTTRSRASSNAETTSEVNSSIYTEHKQHLRVALSKSMLYDVDHRRRSYRRELINLHFDRLHNPDNCYHIRIEWMNTTPRHIQEAVTSWAASVGRFGLRLVEVPIGEASSITAMHPFRAPYKIKLAQTPPTVQPQDYFDATAFVPKPKTDPFFYQKAIMKHHNFVLDFEAASAYPPDVEVTYSWGKPDYRYPQYIHRSGALIAQITNEGDFLLLANRLYNNRSTGSTLHHHESRPSPCGSPIVRATGNTNLDMPPTPTLFRGPSPTNPTTSSPTTAQDFLARSRNTNTPTSPSPSPEQITHDFSIFCSSPATLDAFYTDVLSKAVTPASTPFLAATTDFKTKTPLLSTPLRKVSDATVESDIPNLNLPSSVIGGGKGPTSPPASSTAAAARMERRRETEGLEQEVKDAMKAEMRKVETMRLARGWDSPEDSATATSTASLASTNAEQE